MWSRIVNYIICTRSAKKMTRNYEISHPSNKVSPLPLALPPACALCRPVSRSSWLGGQIEKNEGQFLFLSIDRAAAPLAASGGHGNQDVVQICQKSQRIGCVIPHCNLQRGITQPILRLFLTCLYIGKREEVWDLFWRRNILLYLSPQMFTLSIHSGEMSTPSPSHPKRLCYQKDSAATQMILRKAIRFPTRISVIFLDLKS